MQPNVRLTLCNSEWSVGVVYEAVIGFAEVCELDSLELDDLATAVVEASTNVTWHAYDGAEGPLQVELRALDAAVHAVVRDQGIGIRPHIGEQRAHHVGIGLPLIHARTRRVAYTNRSDGGTELLMEFDMPSLRALEPELQSDDPGTYPDGESVSLSLSPAALRSRVLARLARPLARSAGFTQAAFAALQRFLEALAADELLAPRAQPLQLTLAANPGAVELRLDAIAPDAWEPLAQRVRELVDSAGTLTLEEPAQRPAGYAFTLSCAREAQRAERYTHALTRAAGAGAVWSSASAWQRPAGAARSARRRCSRGRRSRR